MIKKILNILIRLLPGILLILVLFYLGRSNKSSEVYLSVESTAITFSNTEGVSSLLKKLTIDSVELKNGELEFRAKKLENMEDVDVVLTAKQEGGSTMIKNTGSIIFKELQLASNAVIQLEAGSNYLDLRMEATADDSGGVFVNGEINAGTTFNLFSQNMEVNPELDFPINGKDISATVSRLNNTLFYTATNQTIIRLYLQESGLEDAIDLIADIYINNISFIAKDLTKKVNQERSTIVSATLEIAGEDFFGKQFLLKEEEIEAKEFLLLPPTDVYYIDRLALTGKRFEMELSSTKAHDIQSGRRFSLIYSIFPSLLDFIIAEPSKQTIWTIMLFMTAQFGVVRNFIKYQFVSKKSKE